MTMKNFKRNPAGMSMLDYIRMQAELEREGGYLTREEFTRIRNHGTTEELEEALERMEKMGGYENLV